MFAIKLPSCKLFQYISRQNVYTFLIAFPAVFNEPENYAGKIIGLSMDYLTIEQYCEILSKVLAPRVFKVLLHIGSIIYTIHITIHMVEF